MKKSSYYRKILAYTSFMLYFFCFFLTSCNNNPHKIQTSPVFYTDNVSVPLLAPKNFTHSIDALQHIDAQHNGKNYSMDAALQMNDSLVYLVLIGSFGTSLGEIYYAGDSISFKSSVIDAKKTKAEYIVADIQLCFYDFKILASHFREYGFFLEQKFKDGVETRTLYKGKEAIVSVEKNEETVSLQNLLRNYSYKITLGKNG